MYIVGRSRIHGSGCFATVAIGPHVVIGRLEGVATREDGPHVVWYDTDEGFLVTNELRFLNHAAEPNAVIADLDVLALRAIAAGEEITIDYGPDWTTASS